LLSARLLSSASNRALLASSGLTVLDEVCPPPKACPRPLGNSGFETCGIAATVPPGDAAAETSLAGRPDLNALGAQEFYKMVQAVWLMSNVIHNVGSTVVNNLLVAH